MSTVTTIGLDIAKSVCQVHGISATGEVLIRRQVRRGQVLKVFASLPPCLIGIEACASAHHWSRELQSLGHEVRLMPPVYVKPYVKRKKNDMADAEAICEAVTRPTMRFVETKTCEQQSILECELLVGTPSRRALWPAVMRTAATGRTHGRTDQPCRSVKQIPCQRGAVHTWHEAEVARISAYP